jgi:hypothetical protein
LPGLSRNPLLVRVESMRLCDTRRRYGGGRCVKRPGLKPAPQCKLVTGIVVGRARVKESMKRILFFVLLVCTFISHAAAQRLPELAVPENYKLTIHPNFSSDDFTGEETVQVRVLKPVSAIVLNSADIEFREASITAGGNTQKAKVTLDKQKEMATLAVDQPIPPGPFLFVTAASLMANCAVSI